MRKKRFSERGIISQFRYPSISKLVHCPCLQWSQIQPERFLCPGACWRVFVLYQWGSKTLEGTVRIDLIAELRPRQGKLSAVFFFFFFLAGIHPSSSCSIYSGFRSLCSYLNGAFTNKINWRTYLHVKRPYINLRKVISMHTAQLLLYFHLYLLLECLM